MNYNYSTLLKIKKKIVFNDVVFISVISRLIIFLILIFYPIELSNSRSISPILFNAWVDFDNYNNFFNNLNFFIYNYKYFFSNFDFLYAFPGPIFPTLLSIFNYKPGNTIILSALLVVFELLASIKWASYINLHFNKIYSYLFIFNPITIYISYLIYQLIYLFFFFEHQINLHLCVRTQHLNTS